MMNANKKRTIIICTALIIILCAAAAILLMPHESDVSVTEMLTTAQKYLVEMDYERAIAEFNKVIEFDPMNAEAYLGLAEAYEQNGQHDMAVETLEKGYEATGDARIKSMLELLMGSDETEAVTTDPVSETESVTTTEKAVSENILTTAEMSDNVPDIASSISDTMTSTSEIKITEEDQDYIVINGTNYSTDLSELELSWYDLTNEDVKDLYKIKNLTDLGLFNNEITDISVFSKCTNLEHLDLSFNNITKIDDIDAISGLTNLSELYLEYNQITDISALSNLANLRILWLDSNQIEDISSLSELSELTELNLFNNQIYDVSALSGLTNLTSLFLDNNKITDISALMSLTNLTRLNLQDNPISESDVESLREALPNCEIYF